MRQEDVLTVVGHVATAPEERELTAGGSYAWFRLASTTRRYDATTRRYVDVGTNHYSVSVFRALVAGVLSSLRVGDPVIVHGRLTLREWSDADGRHTDVGIEAFALGHDLSHGVTRFRRHRATSGASPDTAPEPVPVSPGRALHTSRTGPASTTTPTGDAGAPPRKAQAADQERIDPAAADTDEYEVVT